MSMNIILLLLVSTIMCRINFMLSQVEHEKGFLTLSLVNIEYNNNRVFYSVL